MSNTKDALDLSANIVLEIERGRKIAELIPQILRLAKIIDDKELEDICSLELSGYLIDEKFNEEKVNKLATLVGRIWEGTIYKNTLLYIEKFIEIYKSEDRVKTNRIEHLMRLKEPIEAFFIKKVNTIHNELKNLYPIKPKDANLRCFITGSNKCTKDIEKKESQIFLAYDYKNKEVDKIIENEIIPIIKKNGLLPIRAKDKIVNYDFMCKICEQIRESRFLLADISEDNLSVGLELGIAIGLQKITMIMADKKAKEIGNLKRTDSIRYDTENIDKLKSDFSNMVGNVIKSN